MSRPVVKILGVDTSLRSTGVGLIATNGMQHKGLYYGTIKNKATLPVSDCLNNLHLTISQLLEEHNPDVVSIEGIFYCRNIKTAIALGQARGAVIAAIRARGLDCYEYAPRKVKQSAVGVGSATKEQVGKMVMQLLGLKDMPQEDAADALAIAICHANHLRLLEALGSKPI